MELFYAAPGSIDLLQSRITLDGAEFKHAAHALRKKQGDDIVFTDGFGHAYFCRVENLTKHFLTATIHRTETEPPAETRLAIAISLLRLPDRFDLFLEKATELGVGEIIPMITEHTVSRPKPEQYASKNERWEKVIHAACKQSGQLWFPVLSPIQSFNDVLKRKDAIRIIPYEAASLQARPDVFFRGHFHGKDVLFLIGGEGGFSEAEVSAAGAAGFEEMSFGKKILRTETAGIFAAALVKADELRTLPSLRDTPSIRGDEGE